MTDPLLYMFLSEEMQKEAVTIGQISSAVGGAARTFGKEIGTHVAAPFQALHPTGKHLRKAWGSFSNAPISRKLTGQSAQRFQGAAGKLRQSGWLANVGRGDFGGAGKVLQYAPGGKALHVGMAGLGASRELASKETETGRKKGLGERVGRAGMGAATGLITAGAANRAATRAGAGGLLSTAAGLAGGHVGERIGGGIASGIGGSAGRAVDVAASTPGKALRMAKKKGLSMPPKYQQKNEQAVG